MFDLQQKNCRESDGIAETVSTPCDKMSQFFVCQLITAYLLVIFDFTLRLYPAYDACVP